MDDVQKRAHAWKEKRKVDLVTLVQTFDHTITIADAEMVWGNGLMKLMFRYVNRKVIEEPANMIRRLCAEEEMIDAVCVRSWTHFVTFEVHR
jgi:hypothetical protein